MITFYKNIAYKLELVVLDSDGKFTTGLSITYEIRKVLDNSLFASGTMTELSSVYYVDVTFTESAEYRVKYVTPSLYENGFEDILVEDYDNFKTDVSALASQISVDAIKTDTESIISTLSTMVADIWSYVTRTITSGGITAAEVWGYVTRTLTSGTKDTEIDLIKTQTDKIPDLDTQIKRILGLSMENHRIFSPIYDANNCLTSATIKIYPTKADTLANTNAIATYSMVATFDAEGKCLTYRMTKE